MKMNDKVVPFVLLVLVILAGCMTYPATVNGAPATVVQPAPVVVQPPSVAVAPPPPVAFEPYPVVENGVTVLIDPEDYYYVAGGVYYHHHYLSPVDVVVNGVPPGYRYIHRPIDLRAIPQKHFHHADVYYHHHPEIRPKGHSHPSVKRKALPEKERRELR
jgi:hypothetical protein